MDGGAVGKVIKSNDPKLKVGDLVAGSLKWARFQIAKAAGLTALPNGIKSSYFIGQLGMPGLSAYFPLHEIG